MQASAPIRGWIGRSVHRSIESETKRRNDMTNEKREIAARLTKRIEWKAQRAAAPADIRIATALYDEPRNASYFGANTRAHLRQLEKAGVIECRDADGFRWRLTPCDCEHPMAVKLGLCDYCGGPSK